jgi:choline dehydrogenase-like flavoprotein
MSIDTLRALVELQIGCLSPTPSKPIDDAGVVTGEVLEHLGTLSWIIQTVFNGGVGLIETEAGHGFGRPFAELSAAERESVLKRIWDEARWHEPVSLVVKLGWLVIYARCAARRRVGFSISMLEPDPPTIDVAEPPRPRLDVEYDVCVVGSGAGGSVVAARAAEAGRRVLMVDDGRWVSPKDFPTRDDRALRDLYRGSGVQPALLHLDHAPQRGTAVINVLQARVVGGGPAINNAIHLPIEEARFREWEEYDCPVTWEELRERLRRVAKDLGVSPWESERARGWRSAVFRAAADRLGLGPADLPVSIHECLGCGGCNSGCRFGRKTGGLHGPRADGAPRSYLDRALAADAQIASRVEAKRFEGGFGGHVSGIQVRDHVGHRDMTIRAKRYVLAAGPIASSQLLRQSVLITSPVGRHLAANVVLPVFATWPPNFPGAGAAVPDPGLQMCVFVKQQSGPLLETWFHYPGSLAVALPEWLRSHVAIMEQYRRLAVCGVVVPTDRRGTINVAGFLELSLSGAEFEQMVNGVFSVAHVFFEAGADRVIPSTVRPADLWTDSFESDKQAFRRAILGPADLNLATAHPQGGNAIGRRQSKSVVSEGFTLFDFKNLFVADASLFPAGCGVNPQMTTMALAHLAADRVLAR